MTDLTKHTQEYLLRRAEVARVTACDMMNNGSREYEQIRDLVDEYIACQHAADIVSGQIGPETNYGDLGPR